MSLLLEKQYINYISTRLERFSWIREYVACCRCPFCGDSQKSSSKRRFYFYRHRNSNDSLNVQCKNCGYSTNFLSFLRTFDEELFNKFFLEKFKSKYENSVKVVQQNNNSEIIKVIQTPDIILPGCIKVSELPDNHFCKKYVKNRKIPDRYLNILWYTENFRKLINNFYSLENVPNDQRLVIPFFNEWNELTVLQGRSLSDNPIIRYITIKLNDNYEKFYGLERLDKSKTILVCEGPIDSLFLPNAVATADSDLLRYNDGDIYIFDNQPRNKEVCAKIENAIDLGKMVTLFPHVVPYKDINDMIVYGNLDVKTILQIIAENTYRGLKAKLEFLKWKRC